MRIVCDVMIKGEGWVVECGVGIANDVDFEGVGVV